jgi:ABC-type nitrate/sulfonate/bicarbonate transport system substrate-binding protein
MLVLMLTSAASGSFVEPASGVETVRVATPGKLVDFSALYVGARLGLYQKEGLNLEFIVMRTGIHYAALQAGEVDYTTLVTSTIRAAIAGMPVRVVLALNNRQPFFLLSQPEIRDGKQLKGKRIAVSAFGSSTDTGARKILKHFGLDANRDAVMLALGDTGLRLAALQARSIDAAMLSPPHSFFAQRQGFNNLMWMGDLGGDGQPTNGLSTTEKKIKEQSDQLRRMLRATVRSMVYVHENKDKALPIVLKEFASWDREAVLQAYDFIVRGMSRDGTVSPSILQEIINEERAISGRNADVPVTQLADFEPLHRVLKEIK